ncbi:ABC transporter ATP-binding protein [Telmatocola sphagniphila]|uniref:ABC transporter ATP-binding protein n=1 Tax=Telmatocola sphagniphila TaxID=1123043 RepID=A0A8E6EZG0_9BACT|nr:ABC transporter ATP-binding protein [Telmatocola sphagniphila]QVL33713.1 ABC transporter ATP-binding protein [Telmatocola sphagniphila]
MSPDVMIQLEGLTIRYGNFHAVNNLDLNLYRGELFGLLGPNGAGKSSTVRVLIGQRKPSSGRAYVAGFDVQRQWSDVKPLFGYVPDRDNHFDEFTGRRNLMLFAGLYNVPEDRVDEVLKQVELSESANVVVRGYSLGMRKKLLLARALLHQPPVLYLDEPTANLDVHSAAIVHRILREHVRMGGTALLTTHNMQEVEAICDRVGILCAGKLVALDTPLALRQRHTERVVDTILAGGERRVFNLDLDSDRAILAENLKLGRVGALHTREFDFHSTFLKLTGTAFE